MVLMPASSQQRESKINWRAYAHFVNCSRATTRDKSFAYICNNRRATIAIHRIILRVVTVLDVNCYLRMSYWNLLRRALLRIIGHIEIETVSSEG